MDVITTATGDCIKEYEDHTREDINSTLDRATEAIDEWRERTLRERETLLQTAGDVLRKNKRDYAELMTREKGEPIPGTRRGREMCVGLGSLTPNTPANTSKTSTTRTRRARRNAHVSKTFAPRRAP